MSSGLVRAARRAAWRLRQRPAWRDSSGTARTKAIRARESRAGSIARRSAAGGAREEDHALRLDRNVRVLLDHQSLAAPTAGAGGGHGGPHPLVELAAELLDQALLVLAQPRVALGDEHLAVARLHA